MSDMRIMKLRSLLGIFLLTVLWGSAESLYGQSNLWVGSWSCAPYAAGSGNTPPSPYIENNTLRQVVRVSIGGDTLRVKFSNKTCSTPVTMNAVNIAVSEGGSAIDASTIAQLKFDGSTSATMNAYGTVTSDPVAFALTPSMRVAITIYYGEAASTDDMTSHVASRTDSYILEGDQSSSADFSGSTITAHWFHINTIDVQAPDTAGCVGVLGNSITDGYGLSGGLQNRWTDIFSEELLDDERTEQVGVLNLGIGGTLVSGSSATSGISRFQDDIMSQSGLRWIIIYYGTNDIAAGVSATTIIEAYQSMIDDAHEKNMKVYGATITPFKGHSHYSEAHEAVRNTVNEWIRTSGNFDACIDFDKAIRDPDDTAKLLAKYSNDWLHPNVDGYAFLGQSVNVALFADIDNTQTLIADAGDDQTLIDYGNSGSRSVTLDGSASYVFGSSIASFLWSEDGSQIATGETPTVDLSVGTHTLTLTLTDTDGNTDTDEVTITIVEDTGVWLEAECGTVGSLWNMVSDEDASNGTYVTIESGNNSTGSAPTDASGLLTYTFDIDESGTYTIYMRVICPSANDDSFWLKMDDGSFVLWNNITSSTSWTWANYASTYDLSEGSHTFTVGYREDGAFLDKLWITNNQANILDEGAEADNCADLTTVGYKTVSDITVYPNAVSEELNIIIPNVPIELNLYNNKYQLLFKQDVQSTHFSIDMTNYPSGIYFLKGTSPNQTFVKRIIKQ